MNVLAFDTCLGAVSVAVRRANAGGELLTSQAFELRERGQAERLMPMIAEVMEAAGLAFCDLDLIAVTVGPGSFTGVRVGVAAARGLALASGLPVVGATGLAVMAHQAFELLGATRGGRLLAAAADARRDMVYLQLFAASGGEMGPPMLLLPEDAAAGIGSRPVVVVGSGASAVADAVAAASGNAEKALAKLQPDACSLAALAADLAPTSSPRPLYLRPADAKLPAGNSLVRVGP
jgi:tRNA threonylcarbamoyladenosine biosynthesis protein TsaB